jgi:septum formation protein
VTYDLSKENERLALGTAKKLVLASTSRYRAQLLARLSLTFETVDPCVDETPRANEDPRALALRLAIAKAQTPLAPADAWVLGSDQVLACRERTLGKPGTRDIAIQQLSACSGSTVSFYTAVCLSNRALSLCYSHTVDTRVTFRELSDREIATYVATEPALDCAGAFKVEGLGISLFTEVISTDPTALEGLPLISVCSMLREANLMN